MNEKGVVRLKIMLFVAVIFLTLISAAPDGRDGRLETEAVEKEWVSTLVKSADDVKGNGDKVKADVDPAQLTTGKTTSDSSSEEQEDEIIECAQFDEMACEKNGTCEVTYKECLPENHLKVTGCLSTFKWDENLEVKSNSTEKYLIAPKNLYKTLGCMQYQHKDMMGCVDDDVCRQERVSRSGVAMCCCTKTRCNEPIHMLNPAALPPKEIETASEVTTVNEEQKKDNLVWCVVGLLIIMFLGIAAVFLAFCFIMNKRKKKSYMKMNTQEPLVRAEQREPQFDLETGFTPPPLVRHEKLDMIPTPNDPQITDLELINNGNFAQVYKAKWTDESGSERVVAVKRFGEQSRQSYVYEKKIYDELLKLPKWCPCVLQMHLTKEFDREYWIVMDFHERLSLYDLLKSTPISITMANRFILTMLDGLQFLHDPKSVFYDHTKQQIIHRDIKSKNILVKSDFTTCIGDFGLARFYSHDLHNTDLLGQVGTRRYMSPEMLEGATDFAASAFKAMDVYSMSLVCWEVLQRTKLASDDIVPPYEMPYEKEVEAATANAMNQKIYTHVCKNNKRPEFREEILGHKYVRSLAQVVEEMWEKEQSGRITAACAFSRIWSIVSKYVEGSEGYISGGSMKSLADDKEGSRDSEVVQESEVSPDSKESKDQSEETKESYTKPEDMEQLKKWHQNPSSVSHPTLDPSKDNCPPPPELPLSTEQGYMYPVDVTSEVKPKSSKEQTEEESETAPEPTYDVAKQRFLTEAEELSLLKQQNGRSDTRCSTPTPESSLF